MQKFEGFSFVDREDLAEAGNAEARILSEIKRLSLEQNVLELEDRGYTVISPDKVASIGFVEQVRDEIIRLMEAENDVTIDIERGVFSQGEREREPRHGVDLIREQLIGAGEIFEKALMNEAVLALTTYLLGESCHLSSMAGIAKGPGDGYLQMHTDHIAVPEPLPAHPYACNATWLLTDYTLENGATCFQPGSHKLLRRPTGEESRDVARFEPVTAPMGSVLLWGGNAWHGSAPRINPGVRMSMIVYYARWFYFRDDPDVTARVTSEMLARNPRRFRRLVGLDRPTLMPSGDAEVVTQGRTCISPFA
jgi:ectoine hydroxylase-related dioxygenase (phytanoyl-CoA dioxygenase family)